jgi:hypothetical protein
MVILYNAAPLGIDHHLRGLDAGKEAKKYISSDK